MTRLALSGAPPRDVPAERLFRVLLAFRPERALAPILGVHLVVRAVPALELRLAGDAAADEEVEDLRASRFVAEVLRRCVHTRTGPAFGSAEDVGRLPTPLLDALAGDVAGALDRIAPTFAGSDVDAWRRKLEGGAMHPSNLRDALALASCVDVVPQAAGPLPRPDRFWRCGTGELLDGHWMAFNAARAVIDRMRKR